MKKSITLIVALMGIAMAAIAQPPADSSPTYTQGATYTLSDGSTVTLSSESLSCSTQYYNVVQVSNGTLNLNSCTFTKTGDGSNGDNSSFYGNNSTIYAGAASSSNYQSTTAGSSAVINITGGTVTSSTEGANAVFATNGATINVSGGSTGIRDVQAEVRTADPRAFTIDGRLLGNEVPSSFRGIYIQNGKKYLKLR